MKAIGRFLYDLFVMTPAQLTLGIAVFVIAFWIMVGPFFGYTPHVKASRAKRRQKSTECDLAKTQGKSTVN